MALRRIFSPAPMLLIVAAMAGTGPVYAELPEAARQMIVNAAREGDAAELATIVKFARKTHPDDGVEIDNLLLSLSDAQRVVEPASVVAPVAPPPQEQPAAPSPVKWSGRGDLGGFHTSGNTESFGITGGATIARSGPLVTHQLRLRGDYQETGGRRSREYFNAAYQGDWKIGERHYALGIIDYERDVLAGFDHRTTTSLGLGWRVIQDEGVALALEAGPAYRHDWLRNGDEGSNFAGRGALTSNWQINDKVRLSHNVEVVAQEESNSLRTITGLQAKLTGRISSQISYDLRYQDRPLFGKESTDTITRIGLTYDF
jgi:putative salt-induced outer membrane protein